LILASKAKALIGGRYNASREDVISVTAPALRHRISMNFDGQSEGINSDMLLNDIVKNVSAMKNYDDAIKV
jgi:MoxR-like ATPase